MNVWIVGMSSATSRSRPAIRQFLEHYHTERNRQGLGNRLINGAATVGRGTGEMHCREHLGGILRYYYRPAG